jgi:hypothetical protein
MQHRDEFIADRCYVWFEKSLMRNVQQYLLMSNDVLVQRTSRTVETDNGNMQTFDKLALSVPSADGGKRCAVLRALIIVCST